MHRRNRRSSSLANRLRREPPAALRGKAAVAWRARRIAWRIALLSVAWGGCWDATAPAAYLWIDYHAGPTTATSTPASVWTPEMWGWVSLSTAGAGAGVVNPLNTGQNAWRVTDSAATIPNPAYVTELTARAAADAVTHGWRFATTARYVTDYGTGPNLGLSAYFGGRAYHLMFDFSPSGDLLAALHDETPRTHHVAGATSGAGAFHRFELQYEPGTAIVTFSVDGRTVDSQWNGVPLAHANTFQWGNSNQAGGNRGAMEFRDVALEIGPFAPGDFNNDGIADGRDFLLWQSSLGAGLDRVGDGNNDGRVDQADLALWRQGFGSTAPSSIGVPEPAAAGLIAWAAMAAGRGRRRRGAVMGER
ncbi:MAG: hypothetical protein DCC67_13575 [Planctomycetota bacterium]|nr:MAG: hypothetical protein DCC67_13575 [Planctomycetota bacterium]